MKKIIFLLLLLWPVRVMAAEQTMKGYIKLGEFDYMDTSPNFVAYTLDAADEKAAVILQAPFTGTISKIGFRTMTVTTGATMDVRVETVQAGGNDPTGTLLGTNSNGAQIIADVDDDTWFTTTLTTGIAVTKGDIFAIVIVNPSGSPGNLQIAQFAVSPSIVGLPYSDLYTTGWSSSTSEISVLTLEYSDGSYYPIPFIYPIDGLNIVNFSSASDPDHRGLKFQLPFPVSLAGIWVHMDSDGDPNVKLYDSDGTTVLETLTIDGDQRRTNSDLVHYYFFTSSHSLSKDVDYRIVFEPVNAAMDLLDFDVSTAAIMDCFPGGQNFHYTEKKDGAWTDTTTKRPWMGLIIDGFDDGVGGGGGSTETSHTFIGN